MRSSLWRPRPKGAAMNGAVFDGMRVVRREHESRAGRSEVCIAADGSQQICLRLLDPECQREFLMGGPQVPVRLHRGVLEVLLPCREGIALARWLAERDPTPAQCRDACLRLVAQCIECRLPPCVVALSARPENLRFSGTGTWLQMLPDWSAWHKGMGEADAVRAVAALCRDLTVPAAGRFSYDHLAPEQILMIRRADSGDYLDWGQLQRDLAALPDTAPDLRVRIVSRLRRIQSWLKRFIKPMLCVAAALLLIAAALSLAANYLGQRQERERLWPGIAAIGDQRLGKEVPHE